MHLRNLLPIGSLSICLLLGQCQSDSETNRSSEQMEITPSQTPKEPIRSPLLEQIQDKALELGEGQYCEVYVPVDAYDQLFFKADSMIEHVLVGYGSFCGRTEIKYTGTYELTSPTQIKAHFTQRTKKVENPLPENNCVNEQEELDVTIDLTLKNCPNGNIRVFSRDLAKLLEINGGHWIWNQARADYCLSSGYQDKTTGETLNFNFIENDISAAVEILYNSPKRGRSVQLKIRDFDADHLIYQVQFPDDPEETIYRIQLDSSTSRKVYNYNPDGSKQTFYCMD